MKKKTAYILLGIFLSTSMLGGCGLKNKATEAASESAQTEKEGTGESEEELTETPTPDGKADAETEEKSSGNAETTASDDKADTETEEDSSADEIQKEKIAVLLPNEEKWTRDADEFKSTLEEDGYEPVIEYAENDASKQVSQIQELTKEEVSAFVIAPVDPYGLKSVLEDVKAAEIPVFSYEDLIMDTSAVKYYVTFGGRQTGQMIGQKIIDTEELDKVREAKESRTIEFFMGSLDDTQALFLYNGLMETLQEYLDDGTLVCKSGKLSFDDTGILRWSKNTAKSRAAELLNEFYPDGAAPDIICTGFDDAAGAVQEVLQETGITPGTDIWPMITGNGCKEDAVKRIAAGTQTFSVFMDARELADQCEEMVNVYLHGDDDPEVNDYEQYDNGVKIIGTYLCEPQMIDRDNYEILIDNGYYTEKEIEPEPTETPEPVTPTPVEKSEPTVTPTEMPEEVSPVPTEAEEETPIPTEKPEPTKKPTSTPKATPTEKVKSTEKTKK